MEVLSLLCWVFASWKQMGGQLLVPKDPGGSLRYLTPLIASIHPHCWFLTTVRGIELQYALGRSIQQAADNLGLRISWPGYSEHKESCSKVQD